MKKRWMAALLALLMVLGTVGIAAAQEEAAVTDEEEKQGPPAFIQEMLERKAEEMENDDEREGPPKFAGEQGPPEFVREMLEKKFEIISQNNLMIQGKPFDSDLPPVIKDGRTLIPVGAVVKQLGADSVKWDAGTRTVTIEKDGKIIELVIGDNKYTVYSGGSDVGVAHEMDTQAQILGNRTFVPLRFIAVALGHEVEWNAADKTIRIGRGQEIAEEARMKNADKVEAE